MRFSLGIIYEKKVILNSNYAINLYNGYFTNQ